MNSIWFYDYPVGRIGIAEKNGSISNVFFDGRNIPGEFAATETELIAKAAAQLSEYFEGTRTEFDLPLYLHGSEFQISVMKALKNIPYGETVSYKEIATVVGNPKASRAVGMANNRNPIAIIIPCHRVVGKNGSLTGYAGGLHIKQYLLELEKLKS